MLCKQTIKLLHVINPQASPDIIRHIRLVCFMVYAVTSANSNVYFARRTFAMLKKWKNNVDKQLKVLIHIVKKVTRNPITFLVTSDKANFWQFKFVFRSSKDFLFHAMDSVIYVDGWIDTFQSWFRVQHFHLHNLVCNISKNHAILFRVALTIRGIFSNTGKIP